MCVHVYLGEQLCDVIVGRDHLYNQFSPSFSSLPLKYSMCMSTCVYVGVHVYIHIPVCDCVDVECCVSICCRINAASNREAVEEIVKCIGTDRYTEEQIRSMFAM